MSKRSSGAVHFQVPHLLPLQTVHCRSHQLHLPRWLPTEVYLSVHHSLQLLWVVAELVFGHDLETNGISAGDVERIVPLDLPLAKLSGRAAGRVGPVTCVRWGVLVESLSCLLVMRRALGWVRMRVRLFSRIE